MKKLCAIILCLLIQPVQSSDHLPRFSSFMWGATTTALVTGAIWYNNSLKTSNVKPIQASEIDKAFIIDKKAKAITQDRSYLLTPCIDSIITSGNIDVRVLEATSKNQITIMSNKYYIGNIETYMAGNTLKLFFNDNNSLHKPVVNIFLMSNVPEYYSFDTSRIEIMMDKSTNRIPKKLAVVARETSFIFYNSIGSSVENLLEAYETSTIHVSKKNFLWSTRFCSSANVFIDNIKQRY